jgi:hypothetical protein
MPDIEKGVVADEDTEDISTLLDKPDTPSLRPPS